MNLRPQRGQNLLAMRINSSAATLCARLAAARITSFPCAARTLAAIAIASACALQAPVLGPVVARSAIQPLLTGSTLPPEFKPARHHVAAEASKSDDQNGVEAEDDAPEEPELEQIPMVPVSEPQSLAV